MSAPVLVVTALENELSPANAPQDVKVVYSGVGKLNAALATAHAIATYRPSLVVNFGTAGRIHEGVAGLIEVGAVVQHDMMAMPLAARGATPFDETPAKLVAATAGALCATGDSFVTSVDPWLLEAAADVVDMELFAIALACHRAGVPWRAFKFITDDANDASAHEWQKNVTNGEALFWSALKAITTG